MGNSLEKKNRRGAHATERGQNSKTTGWEKNAENHAIQTRRK